MHQLHLGPIYCASISIQKYSIKLENNTAVVLTLGECETCINEIKKSFWRNFHPQKKRIKDFNKLNNNQSCLQALQYMPIL